MDRRRIAALVFAGSVLALGAGWVVSAQTNQAAPSGADDSSSDAGPPGVPVIQVPPEITPPAAKSKSDDQDNDTADDVSSNAAPPKQEAVAPPPPPPVPVRSPVAVLQALDKVTAETIRFAVPVGQKIRYKNLVFQVKACETTGLGDPEPQASAYLTIDFQPPPMVGESSQPPKEVYKGWMFSNSPGLHPLQQPGYDAWLISCTAAMPAT
jgi:hypothetical protein